jgi:hypothetical protein
VTNAAQLSASPCLNGSTQSRCLLTVMPPFADRREITPFSVRRFCLSPSVHEESVLTVRGRPKCQRLSTSMTTEVITGFPQLARVLETAGAEDPNGR